MDGQFRICEKHREIKIKMKNDNILIIMPKFYGYEKVIECEARKRFNNVYIIYENRDWVSVWHRFVYVYLPSKKREVLNKFYKKQIDRLPKVIDLVFVIRGSSLSSPIMNYMKNRFTDSCQYIMYQWDGVKNNPEILDIQKYFDKLFTFDIEDSIKYGWNYRPLFYIKDKVIDGNKDIDISFLCSLHSQRAKIQERIKSICKKKSFVFYSHMYCNRFTYYKWKYIGRKLEYKDTNDREVVFKSLSLDETYLIYGRSKVIVDYTHPEQTGFTMRTIEAIGNKCKLITNNKYIVNADFYNPENIFVYDDINFEIPEDFIEKPYESINEELYKYYSLERWFDSFLGEK